MECCDCQDLTLRELVGPPHIIRRDVFVPNLASTPNCLCFAKECVDFALSEGWHSDFRVSKSRATIMREV